MCKNCQFSSLNRQQKLLFLGGREGGVIQGEILDSKKVSEILIFFDIRKGHGIVPDLNSKC